MGTPYCPSFRVSEGIIFGGKCISPDKRGYPHYIFFYFFCEASLRSTHNICFYVSGSSLFVIQHVNLYQQP